MANKTSYQTKSGTEYSIDSEGMMVRNDKLYLEGKESFKYVGTVDHPNAKDTVDSDAISQTRGAWNIHHLLYVINSEGRLGLQDVPFEEVKEHINGRNSLAFVNHNLERMVVTTPLVK